MSTNVTTGGTSNGSIYFEDFSCDMHDPLFVLMRKIASFVDSSIVDNFEASLQALTAPLALCANALKAPLKAIKLPFKGFKAAFKPHASHATTFE